jgi:transcription antitermination protein NusB
MREYSFGNVRFAKPEGQPQMSSPRSNSSNSSNSPGSDAPFDFLSANGLNSTQLREGRRLAVQYLYQLEANQTYFFQQSAFQGFLNQQNAEVGLQPFVLELVQQTLKHLENIDAAIEKHSKNWKIHRIARVDLATLRVCTAELFYRKDVGPDIVIGDAAEIGKLFGSTQSGGFVNGVLDGIYKGRKEIPKRNS